MSSNQDALDVRPGLYRHWKGRTYRVLGLGMHTQSEEPLVLYYQSDEPDKLWARPPGVFLEDVMVDGQPVPRFKLLSEQEFKGEYHD